MIQERILRIRENIAQICRQIGRRPEDITLIGVTKYTSVEKTLAAIAAGITDIGELKVQDAQRKFAVMGKAAGKVGKHMIGHLQTNKVKLALQMFDLIQTVDSVKLAREIDKQAARMDIRADVLLEVNCSGEEQKFGVAQDRVIPLVEQIAPLAHIRVRGLMTMAPFVDDEKIIRRSFRDLRGLSEKISKQFDGQERIQMRYLSMGMSGDYEIALEEGANMLRIGSAIFSD